MNSPTVTGALQYRVEAGAADVAVLGLPIPPGISATAWRSIGIRLGKQHRLLPWQLGDWAWAGERSYADYDEMAEITGLEYATLLNYARVASRFVLSRRRGNLTFSHHSEVASMGSDLTQDQWLDDAEREGWSRNDLRAAIKEATLSEGSVSGQADMSAGLGGDSADIPQAPVAPSESAAYTPAAVNSTLESMRNGITVEHARHLLPRLEEEGISAERWVERLFDEALLQEVIYARQK